jgi:hypothetical protein
MSPANGTTKAVSGTPGTMLTSGLVVPSRLSTASTDAIFFANDTADGTDGVVVNLDTAVDTSLDATYTIPDESAGEEQHVTDMILYSVYGTPKIFFTTARNNLSSSDYSSDIGIAGVDFGSPDPDWCSTTPTNNGHILTGGRPSFVLADNGFLYVLNRHVVHKIDGGNSGGTNGTLTLGALVFLGDSPTVDSGSISDVVHGVDLRGKIWMAVQVFQDFDTRQYDVNNKTIPQFVGIYVWDRLTSAANIQDFIPIPGVREIKSMHIFQGKAACFTISTEGYTQFRVWDGNQMKLVKQMGKTAYPTYKNHSTYETDQSIIWMGNDGLIYMYGMVDGNNTNALYIIGDMTSHVTSMETFTNGGILVAANATETVTAGVNAEGLAFYVSFLDSGGNHLKKWYMNGIETIASNAQVADIGNVYGIAKLLPTMSTVNHVMLRCAPTSTSDGTTIATVKYYFNQSSTASITKTITNTEASKGYLQHAINKPYVTSIQVEIEWSTSETLGEDTFRPSIGLVDYTPTKTNTKDND